MSKHIAEVERLKDAVVVTVSGKIDLGRSPQLHRELLEICGTKPGHVLLELGDVSYIDSSGVGTLVDVARKIKSSSGRLTLVAPSKRVRDVFEITRLDQFFEIVETRAEALSS